MSQSYDCPKYVEYFETHAAGLPLTDLKTTVRLHRSPGI
jgi:hypothetical protein